MKAALVTGGSGFVGSFLVEELHNQGYKVFVFDTAKPEFEKISTFIRGDIRNLDDVQKATDRVDQVFHLAGILGTHETVDDPISTTLTNTIGTLNVLESAKEKKKRVLYVSKPNVWLNPYTISKVAAEQYCLMYVKEFGMDVSIVKWFNVYGPRQRVVGYRKAVPYFVMEALKNKSITIYGDGKQTMDLVYASDTAKATILVANSKKCVGEIVDIGSGKEVTVNELARNVKKFSDSKSKLNHIPMRRGETPHTRIKADITKIKKLTGWKPAVDLNSGLKLTIPYYRDLLKKIKNIPESNH